MKFKPIYIYLFLLVASVVFLVLFTQNKGGDSVANEITEKQMPQDDVHKNLNLPGNQPGKGNVSESYKQQLDSLKLAYEGNPSDTLKMREYADFLMASHNYNEALLFYQKILDKNPRRTEIIFSIASIYYNQKDYKKSEEVINRVLSYDKNNLEARYNAGAIAAALGDKEKARLLWKKIVDENPSSPIGNLAESSLKRL